MPQPSTNSRIQEVIDAVEALPQDDQELLVDVVAHRLAQRRRERLIAEVIESRAANADGLSQRGTVESLMSALDK